MGNVHYRYIITDVDGVILDRMWAYRDVFAQVVGTVGIAQRDAWAVYIGSAGTPIADQIRLACQRYNMQLDNDMVMSLTGMFFREAKRVPVRVFEGAADVIHGLAQSERRLFASTGSHTEEIIAIFESENIRDCYRMILGSDRVPKSQRHVELFAESEQMDMNTFCAHAIFVGDGPRDMEIAQQCGMLSIGITTTVTERVLRKAGAIQVIADVRQIPQIIASCEADART